jgi:hypothetical protein
MANKMWVTEYARQAMDNHGQAIAAGEEPPLAVQVIDFTAGSTATAATLNLKTKFLRLHVDTAASFKVGPAAGLAATIAESRMALGQTEYFGVLEELVKAAGGVKVAAIANP